MISKFISNFLFSTLVLFASALTLAAQEPDRTRLPMRLSPFQGEIRKCVPVFDYNFFEEHTVVKGDNPLPSGESTVEVDFDYAGGGAGKGASITLKVDGKTVATGDMEATVGARFGIDTFGIGEDTGQPVTFDYKPPFKFTGEIEQVKIEME